MASGCWLQLIMTGGSHGLLIVRRALRDFLLFVLAFVAAYFWRFGTLWQLEEYLLSILVGAFTQMVVAYILGLYSVGARLGARPLEHGLLVSASIAASFLAANQIGYLDFSSRIGRGFMAYGLIFLLPLLLGHHLLLFHRHRFRRQRVLLVGAGKRDRQAIEGFMGLRLKTLEVAGHVDVDLESGGLEKLLDQSRGQEIQRVAFADGAAGREDCVRVFRRLRYSGTAVVPLIQLCEEALNYVPLDLVDEAWFLRADARSRLLYFGKLKRSFDVITALVLMLLLGPLLLVGMLYVLVVSPNGPVLFRQQRVGRFGRVFEIWKLRTMREDAERDGPQWSSGSTDKRLLPGATWLRRYRIDEIPQLLNVLRGEMSFVGPRPEQPAFVEQLGRVLPFYHERHMIHPGLTGWAQVRFPYGASIEDSKCKLEYDLYYLKHAGILFDFLILLDTIAVVLRGGLKGNRLEQRLRLESSEADATATQG